MNVNATKVYVYRNAFQAKQDIKHCALDIMTTNINTMIGLLNF